MRNFIRTQNYKLFQNERDKVSCRILPIFPEYNWFDILPPQRHHGKISSSLKTKTKKKKDNIKKNIFLKVFDLKKENLLNFFHFALLFYYFQREREEKLNKLVSIFHIKSGVYICLASCNFLFVAFISSVFILCFHPG